MKNYLQVFTFIIFHTSLWPVTHDFNVKFGPTEIQNIGCTDFLSFDVIYAKFFTIVEPDGIQY